MQALKIEIISDVVCPWCYIGRQHLGLALARVKAEFPELPSRLTIAWSPYQLNPHLPEQGMPRRQYLEQKFGKSGLAGYARIADHARAVNLPMNLEKIQVQPNTLPAHVLMAAAGEQADALAAALFAAYFVNGEDLTDRGVLFRCANEVGLYAARAAAALEDALLVKRVAHVCEEWAEKGVSMVPTFRLETGSGEQATFQGAVPPAMLAQEISNLLR